LIRHVTLEVSVINVPEAFSFVASCEAADPVTGSQVHSVMVGAPAGPTWAVGRRWGADAIAQATTRFFSLTGHRSGLPDRFDRLPVETGQIQI
jgi:hypothetical protein